MRSDGLYYLMKALYKTQAGERRGETGKVQLLFPFPFSRLRSPCLLSVFAHPLCKIEQN